MKSKVQCPHCQGERVSHHGKTTQIIFGLVMAVAGLGFLAAALTHAVGYYLFALPLCTVGSIRLYKGYHPPQVHMHCQDCDHEFEYMLD